MQLPYTILQAVQIYYLTYCAACASMLMHPWQLFVCSHVRELTLTQRTCPSDVVSQRIRSAVLSTIILNTSAIKYHSTYYKCHFPFIFLGTATFNLTFFYRIYYFFCLLTSLVLSSDILFRDRFFFFRSYSRSFQTTLFPGHALRESAASILWRPVRISPVCCYSAYMWAVAPAAAHAT